MTAEPPTQPDPIEASSARMGADEFDELSDILDDLRTRFDETPQWEFCEGFMAALICCRRAIASEEYLPVLLDSDEDENVESAFSDSIQARRFLQLWQRRWNEIVTSLDADVKTVDDERCYHPEVMDLRGMVAQLSAKERATLPDESIPSLAQIWAIGFMFAVESWPEEWSLPRDKDAAAVIDEALEAILELTEDDTDAPTISMLSEDARPSVSKSRLEAFGHALWAVYDLHDVWASIGPRVQQVRKGAEPGRNDPCPCGSGKKYKKCHGSH